MTLESPTLFMSNHRDPIGMWPRLIEFGRNYPNTKFICNASFSFFLKIFGNETIEINTCRYFDRLGTRQAKIKSALITSLGLLTARNVKAIEGDLVVKEACTALGDGKNVFIFPETITNSKLGWRTGIGRMCQNIDLNITKAGFVFIPKPFYEKAKVVIVPAIGSLIDGLGDAEQIAHILQLQHEQLFGKK